MRLVLVVMVVGCGRIDFGAQVSDSKGTDGAGSGASTDGTAPLCMSWSTWSAPQHIGALATADNDWEPALSGDRQTLVYTRQNVSMIALNLSTWQGSAWSAPTPIAALNAGGDAYGAAWNATSTRLYFSSTRTGNMKELYVSTYDGSAFGAPSLVTGLEAVAGATAPTLSDDELEMFYTQDLGPTAANLGHATRATITDSWTDLGPVAQLDVTSVVGWPSLSPDGLSIYVENDGLPAEAIQLATRTAVGAAFGTPVDVSELDTNGNNGDPEISRDGTTMVFSSDRSGAGQADLFMSTRTCL